MLEVCAKACFNLKVSAYFYTHRASWDINSMNEDVHFALLQFCDSMLSLYRKNQDAACAISTLLALIYMYNEI